MKDIRGDDHEPVTAEQVARDNPTPIKVVDQIDAAMRQEWQEQAEAYQRDLRRCRRLKNDGY